MNIQDEINFIINNRLNKPSKEGIEKCEKLLTYNLSKQQLFEVLYNYQIISWYTEEKPREKTKEICLKFIENLQDYEFYELYLKRKNNIDSNFSCCGIEIPKNKEDEYDFIEIGTSDFDTLIQECHENTKGICIEPIKSYLDNLPNKPNVIKLNIGISNKDGDIDIYYVTPENIKKYNFPYWIKGCNSVNNYHPSVKEMCLNKKLSLKDVCEIEKINVLDIKTFLKDYNIKKLKYLKIDTEGHDTIILKSLIEYLKINKDVYIYKILYESNSLSKKEDTTYVNNEFIKLGYYIDKEENDTILINNNKYI